MEMNKVMRNADKYAQIISTYRKMAKNSVYEIVSMGVNTPIELFILIHLELLDILISSDGLSQRCIMEGMNKFLEITPTPENCEKSKALAMKIVKDFIIEMKSAGF